MNGWVVFNLGWLFSTCSCHAADACLTHQRAEPRSISSLDVIYKPKPSIYDTDGRLQRKPCHDVTGFEIIYSKLQRYTNAVSLERLVPSMWLTERTLAAGHFEDANRDTFIYSAIDRLPPILNLTAKHNPG